MANSPQLKIAIIAGSSRKDGDTAALVDKMKRLSNWDVIDLNDYEIYHYDYENSHKQDDYLPLMERIVEKYDTLVFATPVYWYSMSGKMKVFFDRMTDLLTIEKELGRKLRGKKMAAVSCSAGDNLGDSFWLPFLETAKYLGMEYLGNLHTIAGDKDEQKIKGFIKVVENKNKS